MEEKAKTILNTTLYYYKQLEKLLGLSKELGSQYMFCVLFFSLSFNTVDEYS